MERIVEQNLLYDFYGELLNDHQKKVYEDAVYGDLSLSELAEEYGITRQGVHDLIKRCDKILEGYEEKLQLMYKFQQTKKIAGEIGKITEELLTELGAHEKLGELKALSEQMEQLL